jgi:hypothetical protein
MDDLNEKAIDTFKEGIPDGVLEGYLTGKYDALGMGMA